MPRYASNLVLFLHKSLQICKKQKHLLMQSAIALREMKSELCHIDVKLRPQKLRHVVS